VPLTLLVSQFPGTAQDQKSQIKGTFSTATRRDLLRAAVRAEIAIALTGSCLSAASACRFPQASGKMDSETGRRCVILHRAIDQFAAKQ
jgi:hypothetical protein